MKKNCPYCHTEMVPRFDSYACPMNDIGACVYDVFDYIEDPRVQLSCSIPPFKEANQVSSSDSH
ncbi:hypothetical protein [Vibrio sp. SCSIO 43136]|uniref:hypothetical protein n=1 Tax=Vibrio sp. SCSIO 43136 TaxID=2819101 RepID=UPI002075F802|nr:hypothetical protein [Vibrio sp. SCSIO 43136]USD67261.1 hypothetical protein J4N39_21760 [Vibrio sp. SCSIO 43136]